MSYIATSMTVICDRIRLLALDHFEFLLAFMNGVLCLDIHLCFLSSMQAIKVGLISRGRNSCFYAHGYYTVKYTYQSFSTFPFPDTFQFLVANSYLGSCFQNFFPGIQFFLLFFLQRNPFQRIVFFRLVKKWCISTIKEGKAIEKDEHRVLVTHPNNGFQTSGDVHIHCCLGVILTGQFLEWYLDHVCLRADNYSFLYYIFSSLQISSSRFLIFLARIVFCSVAFHFNLFLYGESLFFADIFLLHSALQLLGKMDLLWKRILMLLLGFVLN